MKTVLALTNESRLCVRATDVRTRLVPAVSSLVVAGDEGSDSRSTVVVEVQDDEARRLEFLPGSLPTHEDTLVPCADRGRLT